MKKIKEIDNGKDVKEVGEKQVKNMKTKVTKKEVMPASYSKWKDIGYIRFGKAVEILQEWFRHEDIYKGQKHVFPELKNLEGFLLIEKTWGWCEKIQNFAFEMAVEVEDFVEFSIEQLGDKICYDQFVDDPLCLYCSNLVMDYREAYCKSYPHMGRICGKKHGKNFHANLIDVRSNTHPWYWCIRICPDFKYEKNKISERKEIIKKLTKNRVIEI